MQDRPDYDMFRYGGNYYAYNNNQWYRSRRDRGEFRAIDERLVPRQFTMVPREHWRNYPTAWTDANGNSRYDHRSRGNGGDRNAQPTDRGDHGDHR